MTKRIVGTIINPDGSPLSNTPFKLVTKQNNSPSLTRYNQFTFSTDSNGAYDEVLEPGYYRVTLFRNNKEEYLGDISFTSGTDTTLPTLLEFFELPPRTVDQELLDIVEQAEDAAAAAAVSAQEAADSAASIDKTKILDGTSQVFVESTNGPVVIDVAGTERFRIDTGGDITATGVYQSEVAYSNVTSGLSAVNVQAAIDEVDGRIDSIEGSNVSSYNGRTGVVVPVAGDYGAVQVDYSNATSGLTATDTQAAIDEVDGRIDSIEGIDHTKILDGTSQVLVESTNGPVSIDTAGVERFRIDSSGKISTGGTVPDVNPGGISLKHTQSGDLLNGKNSLLSQPNLAAADDTYFSIRKNHNTNGGLRLSGFSGSASLGVKVYGYSGMGTIDTSDTGEGTIEFDGRKYDGVSGSDRLNDDENLISFANYGSTKFVIKGNGDIVTQGNYLSDVAYDNTTSGLTATTVQAAIDELETAHVTPVLSEISDGTSKVEVESTNGPVVVDTAGVEQFRIDAAGKLSTGAESAADCTSGGITFNQGTEDGPIITLKSDDVDHGVTGKAETDTYGSILKAIGSSGGMELRGLGGGSIAFHLNGYCGSQKSGDTDTAPVVFSGSVSSGASAIKVDDDSNVLSLRNLTTVETVIKGNGDIVTQGGLRLGGGLYVLGDYEKGSWTPVFEGSTVAGSHTYSEQAGRYIRIGDMVFVNYRINISTKDAAMDGDIRISGLPFTSEGTALNFNSGSIDESNHINYTDLLLTSLAPSSTLIYLRRSASGSTDLTVNIADNYLGLNPGISGSLAYEV